MIPAQSYSPQARAWLRGTRTARVLHVFRSVCNLINGEARVLTIASPKVGNGPFTLVVHVDDFTRFVEAESQVACEENQLDLGGLKIGIETARLWNPRPDWKTLAARRENLPAAAEQIARILRSAASADSLAFLLHGPDLLDESKPQAAARRAIESLALALGARNTRSAAKSAESLAGLGVGLTPAGDDFLVGIMLAAWASLSEILAGDIGKAISSAAAPRTTALSAAWLQAAARSEAGEPWHALLDAIAKNSEVEINRSARNILPTGHTSGADALAGFVFGIRQWLD